MHAACWRRMYVCKYGPGAWVQFVIELDNVASVVDGIEAERRRAANGKGVDVQVTFIIRWVRAGAIFVCVAHTVPIAVESSVGRQVRVEAELSFPRIRRLVPIGIA